MIQHRFLRYSRSRSRGEDYNFPRTHYTPSVEELLKNPDKYLENIPKDQLNNIHYTLFKGDWEVVQEEDATTGELKDKHKFCFVEQEVIPFDLDHVDKSRYPEYMKIVFAVVSCSSEASPQSKEDLLAHCSLVDSGYGLHILCKSCQKNPIVTEDYFRDNRVFYNKAIERIHQLFKKHNLPGKIDPGPFKPKATLRTPNTINDKIPDKPIMAKVMHVPDEWKPMEFDWQKIADFAEAEMANDVDAWTAPPLTLKTQQAKAHAARDFYQRPETLDVDRVLNGCAFLKWAKENPNDVFYDPWFHMGNILTELDDTGNLYHEYSKDYNVYRGVKHNYYTYEETEGKVQEHLKWYSEGKPPRSCNYMEGFFDCSKCKYHKRVTHPTLINAEAMFPTKKNGFYKVYFNEKTGKETASFDMPGLFHYVVSEHNIKVVRESPKTMYRWIGTHWEKFTVDDLRTLANSLLNEQYVKSGHIEEFVLHVRRSGELQIKFKDLNCAEEGKINLENCVVDCRTGETFAHSPEHYAMYTLPYAYDPEATCPKFNKFLDEVLPDKECQDLLLHFLGCVVANVAPKKLDIFLVMYGEGSNGKSVLLGLIEYLLGDDAVSNVPLKDMCDTRMVPLMIGKTLNIDYDASTTGTIPSEPLKKLTSGDPFTSKLLYENVMKVKLNTKLIIAANAIPNIPELSKAIQRRIYALPFTAYFDEMERDKHIDPKLHAEAPGILNKLLAAYKRAVKNDFNYKAPEVVDYLRQEMRYDQNPLVAFKEDCLVDSLTKAGEYDGSYVFTDSLFEAYKNYCIEQNMKPKSKSSFVADLKKVLRTDPKRYNFKPKHPTTGARKKAIKNLAFTEEYAMYADDTNADF